MILSYDISELIPYINWPYFFFAWQVKESSEKDRLRQEAEALLQQLEGKYHAYGLFELFDVYSDGDDIVVGKKGVRSQESGVSRIPCLRQQQGNPPYLCLSDFLPPQNISTDSCLLTPDSCPLTPDSCPLTPDSSKIGVFASSVSHGLETDFDADPYQKMMAQLLADRLAEAAAERMHEQVRKEYWGYAKDENLSIPDMLVERFQGIRPAVGYPSLPDTSLNFVLDDLIDMKQIGIRLTESGAMKPHASVSGLMLAHPEARYFSIGKIGEDQLRDYANRRGLPLELCRRFLAANL
jgi:cobalamin-dependent methionine synthase I